MFNLHLWKQPRGAGTRPTTRKTFRDLQNLDDHLLRDIGLSRSDLPSFHRGYDPRTGAGAW